MENQSNLKHQLLLFSLLFFIVLLSVPTVSAFQLCKWVPFWSCSDDITGNTLTSTSWITDYSTDNDTFVFIYNKSKKHTKICLVSETATKTNDLKDKDLYKSDKSKKILKKEQEKIEKSKDTQLVKKDKNNKKIEAIDISSLDKKPKIKATRIKQKDTGLDKDYFGWCYDVKDKEKYIKFGNHSTVVTYLENSLEVTDENGTILQQITLEYNTEQCLVNCKAGGQAVLYQDSKLFEDLDFKDLSNSLIDLSNSNVYLMNEETEIIQIPNYQINCTNETIINGTNETIIESCDFVYDCNNITEEINGTNVTSEVCNKIIESYTNSTKVTENYTRYDFSVLPSGNYNWEIRGNKEALSNIDWAVAFQGFSTDTIRQYWAWWNSSWEYKKEISNLTGEYPTFNLTKPTDAKPGFGDTRFVNENGTTELNFTFRQFGNPSGLAYANLPSSITSNLVSYYKFDDDLSTKNVIDSDGSNDGTSIINTNIQSVTGFLNKAQNITSSSNYITLTQANDLTKEFTISTWINIPDTNNYHIILSSWTAANPQILFWIFNNNLVFNTFTASQSGGTTQQFSLKNQWVHVVATYDGTTMKTYVNGIRSETTYSQSGDLKQGGEDHRVGSYSQNTAINSDIAIDEMIILDSAISEDEVRQFYNAQWAYVTVDTNNESTIDWFYGNLLANTTESINNTFLFPVSGWFFDEGITDLFDSNDLTNHGATETTGYISSGYDFEESESDWMDAGTGSNMNPSDDLTLSAWVNIESRSGEDFVIGRWSASSNYGLGIHNSGDYFQGLFRKADDTGQSRPISNTTFTFSTWQHLLATYEQGVGGKVYMDGILVGVDSSYTGALRQTLTETVIGALIKTPALEFDGIIDEVMIYDKALTSDEVYELSTMSDQTDTMILGDQKTSTTITLTLIEPENNTFFINPSIDFQCNCEADSDNCTQINLTIDGTVVKSQSGTGSFNLTSTESISEGNHNWTCFAANQTGYVYNTSTFFFSVDSTPPVINITYPLNGFTITDFNELFNLNWTITELHQDRCWYFGDYVGDVINDTSVTISNGYYDYNSNNLTNSTGTGDISFDNQSGDIVINDLGTGNLTGNWTSVTTSPNCVSDSYTNPSINTNDNIGKYFCVVTDQNNLLLNEITNNGKFNWSYYPDVTNPTRTEVNCSSNTTTVNYPIQTPDNLTLTIYVNDSGGLRGFDTVFIKRSFVSPNITIVFPVSPFTITNFNETINVFFNLTANNTDTCYYNTSEDSNLIFSNCSLGYFTYNYPTYNPENVTFYVYSNDTLGNLGTDNMLFIKNNIIPNITIYEPFTTYDSIDIGEPLNLNTTTTSSGVLDSCWYTYPDPWNYILNLTSPISDSVHDNNDSTVVKFENGQFYFNNSINNLTYRGADCSVTSGLSCTDYYNISIDTSSCSVYDVYSISTANIANFGCNRQMNITCGSTLLYTETASCLSEPHNVTVDLFPSSDIILHAPDNGIKYTCNSQTSFNYLLSSDTVYVYSNDTLGNLANVNRSWISIFNIENETYDSEKLVSESNDFRLDVVTSASSITNPELVYLNKSYPSSLTIINSSNFYLTSSVLTYQNMTGNNSFHWNITLDGTEYSSTSSYQNVSDINFSICGGVFNITYLRINFIDESTSSPLSSVIRTSSFDYYIDNEVTKKTYTYGVTSNSTIYEFCSTPGTETLIMDGSVSYYSNGYPERTTSVTGTLSNTSTNTTLSLLASDAGIYPTITFIDSITKVGLSGVSYKIYDGSVIAAEDVTGSSGTVSPYLNPNIKYSVDYSKDGYGSYSDKEYFTSPTREYLFEMDSGGFETTPELQNGLQVIFYPDVSNLDNGTQYNFGAWTSNGDQNISTMSYYLYDEDGNELLFTERPGEGNISQNSIITYENKTFTAVVVLLGDEGSKLNITHTYYLTIFHSDKYSLNEWGLSFNNFFPSGERSSLTLFVWFMLWFILMLGGFTFGYNGSFSTKTDQYGNSPESRGSTTTGLIFAFIITLFFTYFNLIPVNVITVTNNTWLPLIWIQQNLLAIIILVVLIWDVLAVGVKHARRGN